MHRRVLFAAILASSSAFGFSSGQVQDISWQAQFAGAVHWSAYGVVDDSGVTDNTAALNSIPGGVPIIADCPTGGFVQFTGTWSWPNNLTIWQSPGCYIKTTITTAGVYPFVSTDSVTIAPALMHPTTGVQYYGFQVSAVTPSSGARMLYGWFDHFTLKYCDINGSGGFAVIAGGDQEIGYCTQENTINTAGNPGIRHLGNIPSPMLQAAGWQMAATSPGRPANVWFHNLELQTGDGSFESCQPLDNPLNWNSLWSTDGITYENSYGNSTGSAVMLINEVEPAGADNYTCKNVEYLNVSGTGYYYALIFSGAANTTLTNVTIDTGTYSGAIGSTGLYAISAGVINAGGHQSTAQNMDGLTINNVSISQALEQNLNIVGPIGHLSVANATLGVVQGAYNLPNFDERGTTGAVFSNITANANLSGEGFSFGDGAASSGISASGLSVTQVRNAKFGIELGNVASSNFNGGVLTIYPGATTATGIALTSNPNGTNGTIVTGFNLSSFNPADAVVCAPGQGNNVTGNTGAADCAP